MIGTMWRPCGDVLATALDRSGRTRSRPEHADRLRRGTAKNYEVTFGADLEKVCG